MPKISKYHLTDSEVNELNTIIMKKCEPTLPIPQKSLRDCKYLVLLTFLFILMVCLALYGLFNGDISKFVNRYDSWGNVCGRKNNVPIPGVEFSGMDHSNRTYVMFTGDNNIRPVLKPNFFLLADHYPAAMLCLTKCPTSKVTDCHELLIKNGYNLPDELIKKEVCVMLLNIIFPQTVELNRCIPSKLLQVNRQL